MLEKSRHLCSSFYVWKRNDGHIGATVYMPKGWEIHHGPYKGEVVTFEQLGHFTDWAEVEKCVEKHRKELTS